MTPIFAVTVMLAFVWGVVWALFLQTHRYGRWLAIRRTWLTVVVGVGVDLLLLLLVLDACTVATVTVVIAASSLGIIARSLANEHSEDAQ